MKWRLLALVLLTILSLSLAACGGDDSGSSDKSQPTGGLWDSSKWDNAKWGS
jgi:ABC-type oligopeptide transport system substrate-binding subunit